MHPRVQQFHSLLSSKDSSNNLDDDLLQQAYPMINDEDHEIVLEAPNRLSTEEEIQIEARKKVSKHLSLANLIEEWETPIDFIVKKYIDTIQFGSNLLIDDMDPKILDKYIKIEKLKLKAMEMMREDIWLKKKQEINIKVWRDSSLWRRSLWI